jgi:hypothetical protein
VVLLSKTFSLTCRGFILVLGHLLLFSKALTFEIGDIHCISEAFGLA